MKNFLSGVAFLVSICAVAISVFTAYKVSNLEQSLDSLNRSSQNQATSPTEQGSVSATTSPPPVTSTASNVAVNNVSIQPGQYVQPAWGNKGQVELLAVKRISDPETGTRDVVNVQFRVRHAASTRDEDVSNAKVLWPDHMTTRNPDTSEAYKAINAMRATGSVYLNNVTKGASLVTLFGSKYLKQLKIRHFY
jgi:hypothetical protein